MENELKQRILAEYPYPIAIFFKKMIQDERLVKRKKGAPQTLFFSLLDLFEMTNRFLAIIAISQYVADGAHSDQLNQLVKSKLQKNLSLGDWQELLRETIRHFHLEEEDNNPFKKHLYEFYYKTSGSKVKFQGIVEHFNEMIHIRNKKRGHSPNLTPKEYEELYQDYYPKVMNILNEISFLAGYSLISPIEVEDQEVTEYLQLKGTNFIECYEPIMINSDTLDEGDIYLFSEDYQLKLSPLSFYELDYEAEMEQYLWLYEGNKMAQNTVKSLTYYGFTPIPKNTSKTFGRENKDKGQLLEQFFQLISIFFKEELAKMAEASHDHFTPEDYYFKSQRALIDYYRSSFFGRDGVIQSIKEFIEKVNSGYFLLKGVPGQGKTAIMAQFVHEHSLPHHFISQNDGRDDEEAIIKSLYVQIAQKMGTEIRPFPASLTDLKRNFQNLLQSYSDYCELHQQKGVIVIDGLDELKNLEESISLAFLPLYLPKHIYAILSSRPNMHLSKLDSKINKQMELSELGFEAVKAIIEQKVPGIQYEIIRKLFAGSNGNPLLLKCMLEDYIKTGSISSLTSIESFFEKNMIQLREQEDSLPLDILCLLITAKEALSVYEIGKIVKRPKYKVLKAIPSIVQLLIRTDNKYQVFHKKLLEYLTDPTKELSFDEEELNTYHRSISEYCEEGTDPYYRDRYWVYHLYELKKMDRIVSLAAQPEFEYAMVELIKDKVFQITHDDYRLTSMKELVTGFIEKNEPAVPVLLKAFEKIIQKGAYEIVLDLMRPLEEKLAANKAVQQKIIYIKMRISQERGQLQKAEQLFDQLEQEEELFFNDEEKMLFYLAFGNLMREKGDRIRTLHYYELALQYCDKDEDVNYYLDIYQHVCDMVYVQGKFKKAIHDLDAAIMLARQHGLTLQAGQLLRIKGQVYYVLDLFKEAITCYEEGLECFLKVNDPIELGKMYNNISEAYAFVNTNEAMRYNQAAFELNQKNEKKIEIGKSEMIRGMIERESGHFSEAVAWMERSVTTLSEVGYISGVGKTIYQMALTYLQENQWEKAVQVSQMSNIRFLNRSTPGYPTYIIKNYILQYYGLVGLGQVREAENVKAHEQPKMECFEIIDDVYQRIDEHIKKYAEQKVAP